MCLDEPIQDDEAHIDLPAGCQVLYGPNALGFRARPCVRPDLLPRHCRAPARADQVHHVDSAVAGTLLDPVKLTRTVLSGVTR
jgi:hypothetical protein